jgi:hypothetical protein
MAKKEPAVFVRLPAGTAGFSYLHKPDTEGTYADGKYKVTIVYDKDVDLSEIEKVCVAEAKKKWPKLKPSDVKMPFRDGDETGKEELEGKVTVTPKSKFQPKLVDAKRNELPESVKIFGGDIVKAVASLYLYESTENVKENGKTKKVTVYGVSLQLAGVQLIEKRGGRGGDVSSMFDEEDGFEAEASEDEETTNSGSDAVDNEDF